MRMPSLKTLREAFGDDAPEARKILKSTRYALAQRPECDALIRGASGSPAPNNSALRPSGACLVAMARRPSEAPATNTRLMSTWARPTPLP